MSAPPSPASSDRSDSELVAGIVNSFINTSCAFGNIRRENDRAGKQAAMATLAAGLNRPKKQLPPLAVNPSQEEGDLFAPPAPLQRLEPPSRGSSIRSTTSCESSTPPLEQRSSLPAASLPRSEQEEGELFASPDRQQQGQASTSRSGSSLRSRSHDSVVPPLGQEQQQPVRAPSPTNGSPTAVVVASSSMLGKIVSGIRSASAAAKNLLFTQIAAKPTKKGPKANNQRPVMSPPAKEAFDVDVSPASDAAYSPEADAASNRALGQPVQLGTGASRITINRYAPRINGTVVMPIPRVVAANGAPVEQAPPPPPPPPAQAKKRRASVTADVGATLSDSDRVYANSGAAQWLMIQKDLSPDSVIKARITEYVVSEDGSQVQASRTYVYVPTQRALKVASTSAPFWTSTLDVLRRLGKPHTGAASAGAVAFHKSARIVTLQRPNCIALDAPRPGDGLYISTATKAPFPPLDNDLISAVESVEVLSAHETSELLKKVHYTSETETATAFAAAFADRVITPAPAATLHRLKENVWEAHERTDADVGKIVENFGRAECSYRRDLPPHHHRAWRMLAANVFAGYSNMNGEEKGKAIKLLLALPKLHLKILFGSHSTHVREAHLVCQLAGNVCTQLAKREAAAPPRKVDPTDVDAQQEALAKTVARVINQAAEGHISDGYKMLQRSANPSQGPRPTIEQTVEDLKKLHPKGDPPKKVELPAERLYTSAVVPVAAVLATAKKKCNASSPGPSGWTPELLHVALGDATFASAFRDFTIDICNGDLAPDVDILLSMSNIIGIPKETGGTRPIAMGETFLKIAVDIAVQRCSTQITEVFRDTQRGVNCPGGAEKIVHEVRDFIREGIKPHSTAVADKHRVVVLLDAKNAFNMPFREAMHQSLLNANIPGLLGVFKTAYAQHGIMFVVGSNGEHIIASQCGARQGSVDGSVIFSVGLQPALNTITEAQCDAFIRSYLDDSTICGDGLSAADTAVSTYGAHLTSMGGELQPKKCEIIMPGLVHDGPIAGYEQRVHKAFDDANIPADSPLRSFKIVSTVKLLGASIANKNDEEAEHLLKRLIATFDNSTDLISKLPASPQALAFIRLCLLPSLSYHLRVHHPDVTRQLTRHCDARVEYLIQTWAQSHEFGVKQLALLRAPRVKGGAGIASLSATAPAAYVSSALAAKHGRGPPQRHIISAVHDRYIQSLRSYDSSIVEFLKLQEPSGCCLGTAISTKVSEDTMGAYFRLVFASPSENAEAAGQYYTCPGCSSIAVGRKANNLATAGINAQRCDKKYTAHDFACHAAGCAAMPGGAVTKRHNDVCDLLCKYVKAAGYSAVEREPRKLRTYDCPCGLVGLSHDAYVDHRKVCAKAIVAPRAHGPDLLFTTFEGQTYAIDVRIPNEMCATHRGKPLDQVFAEAAVEKEKKYGEICTKANVILITFCVSALGALSTTSKALLKSIVDDAPDMALQTLCSNFSARAAAGTAQALLTAESHLGIRPAQRSISQAVLKLLEASLKVSLTTSAFDKETDPKPRLGVPAPTADVLNGIMARLDRLLASFDKNTTDIIKQAEELKAAEAADAAKEVANAGPQHVVRLASAEALHQRAKSREHSAPPPAQSPQRDAAKACAEARQYAQANIDRNIANATADARSAVEARLSVVREKNDEFEAEVTNLYQVAGATADRTKVIIALNNATVAAIDATRDQHRRAASQLRESTASVSAEIAREQSLRISQSSAKHAIAESRQSLSASQQQGSQRIFEAHRAEKSAKSDAASAQRELDATAATLEQRSRERALSEKPTAILGWQMENNVLQQTVNRDFGQNQTQQQKRSAPFENNNPSGRYAQNGSSPAPVHPTVRSIYFPTASVQPERESAVSQQRAPSVSHPPNNGFQNHNANNYNNNSNNCNNSGHYNNNTGHSANNCDDDDQFSPDFRQPQGAQY